MLKHSIITIFTVALPLFFALSCGKDIEPEVVECNEIGSKLESYIFLDNSSAEPVVIADGLAPIAVNLSYNV